MIFERTELLIGKENLKKLNESYVGIFGLGGIGSHVAEFLARAGVGKFLLVDFDTISRTNINRVISAVDSTVGKPKTDAMKERILSINPNAIVETYYGFFDEETKNMLLDRDFDIVVDAIDSMNLKVLLIEELYKREIKAISSMGAAGKLDVTKIKIADISKTHMCPLARRVRKMLHRRDIKKGIMTVFSPEESVAPVDPDSVNAELLDRGRVRKIHGTMSYYIAVFSGFIVNWMISELIKN